MNQEVQDYFTEPEEIIKKCCEVLQFQKQHRRRLLSYLLQSVKHEQNGSSSFFVKSLNILIGVICVLSVSSSIFFRRKSSTQQEQN